LELGRQINKRDSQLNRPVKESDWFLVGLTGIGIFLGWLVSILNYSVPDLFEAGFITGVTLFITAIIVRLWPHLFDLRTLRLPGFFLASYLVMIIIPATLVYFNPQFQERRTFLLATNLGFLFFIFGIVAMGILFPSSTKEVQVWIIKPLLSRSKFKPISIVLLSVCLLSLALYISIVGDLPILKALRGGFSAVDLAFARENALKLIRGPIVYLFTLLRNSLLPFVALLLLVIAISSHKIIWKFLFVVALISTLIMSVATLEKSPVVLFVVMLFFTWLLANGRRFSLKLKHLIPIGILAFIFPVAVYLFAGYGAYPEEILRGIIRRLFYLPSEVLYNYFLYFPGEQNFLLGRALPYISKFFLSGPFPVANRVCLYMRPDNIVLSCNANAAYIGYLWADFGWMGILQGSFLCGMVLQGIQLLILRLPKSAPTIAIQAMFVCQVVYLTSTSFTDLVDPLGRGFVILLMIAMLSR
jgi:oligosaccharide repeat unit polymerase